MPSRMHQCDPDGWADLRGTVIDGEFLSSYMHRTTMTRVPLRTACQRQRLGSFPRCSTWAAMKRTVALLLIALIAALPSAANACSCSPVIDWGFIGPAQGSLPANAAGVLWFQPEGGWSGNLESRFTAEILEGEEFRQLPVQVSRVDEFAKEDSGIYVVSAGDKGLKPGSTYRFSVDRADMGHDQVIVTVDLDSLSDATAFDLVVGKNTSATLRVAAAVQCLTGLDVSLVRIEGRLPLEKRRWREQLLYRTIVNEEVHWQWRSVMCATVIPGRSMEAAGHDLVYADCDSDQMGGIWYEAGLEPGRYSLKMQAYLPGTGFVLETGVRTVDLNC